MLSEETCKIDSNYWLTGSKFRPTIELVFGSVFALIHSQVPTRLIRMQLNFY